MTQKIKLMSDEEILEKFELTSSHPCAIEGMKIDAAKWAKDECESRAFEKIKEVAKWFWERSRSYSLYLDGYEYTNFEECLQQFLKEQQNQEAITLLKEWKERDGSEIEENYNKLIKEQDGKE